MSTILAWFVEVELTKQDQVGAVESVKAASDIYAPISGEVIEANTELEGNPTLINESPYAQGLLLGWKTNVVRLAVQNQGVRRV